MYRSADRSRYQLDFNRFDEHHHQCTILSGQWCTGQPLRCSQRHELQTNGKIKCHILHKFIVKHPTPTKPYALNNLFRRRSVSPLEQREWYICRKHSTRLILHPVHWQIFGSPCVLTNACATFSWISLLTLYFAVVPSRLVKKKIEW